MKKIISILMCAAMLLAVFASCSKDDEEESYDTRTAAFYASINKESFWYKAYITENGETYSVTQATNGVVTTTIEDHDKNSQDKYHLYDGKYIQSLNFSKKCYDTIATKNGIPFRFAEYEPSMFPAPHSTDTVNLSGISYYCETYNVVPSKVGVTSAVNNYYFDGDRLSIIEIVENGKTTLVIEFEDYSNTIPSEVYLEVPEDFSARNYIEENETDFSTIMSDWIDDLPSKK